MRYGGNTSCVELSLDDGSHLILDAGTGIRELGLGLVDSGRNTFHVCLTHLHLDHLEGLAFFAPVWRHETEVDVLLHDAQYTRDEYADHVGWGHSSVDDAVAFAQVAEVARLLLFHHDPAHADADLEAIEATARSLWGGPVPPALAAEGMSVDL